MNGCLILDDEIQQVGGLRFGSGVEILTSESLVNRLHHPLEAIVPLMPEQSVLRELYRQLINDLACFVIGQLPLGNGTFGSRRAPSSYCWRSCRLGKY